MSDPLREYAEGLEALADRSGLDYFPVEFELVPPAFMMEVAVYGLPVRMPHWSFGIRYIYQLVQHRMGHSRIFEVVFPGNPGRAYMADSNTLEENTLVTAHVLGHADFAKNNLLFRRSQEQVGYHIVEQAAAHAHRISSAIEEFGQERVEQVLDAALALEQHIDTNLALHRALYPTELPVEQPRAAGGFHARYDSLPGEAAKPVATPERRSAPIPPLPELDLLWFIAHYAPDMDDWERDIFLSVREESFYFYPVFACQIMNEGWASYWHARLLREARFLPQQLYLNAIKAHSDVVRPYAGERQVALAVNPYHVGFRIWEKVVEEQGMEAARRVMKEEDDFGFVRNYLNKDLAHELELFTFIAEANGRTTVRGSDIDEIREAILRPKYNFGAPRIAVQEVRENGMLVLTHEHGVDGRGLDPQRSERVLDYIHRVWRRPIRMYTVDATGRELVLSRGRRRND
jgi:stage V sporulation protein R